MGKYFLQIIVLNLNKSNSISSIFIMTILQPIYYMAK